MKLGSARAVILWATGLLIALPLLLVAIAYGYERWLVGSERRHLEELGASLAHTPDRTAAARAARVSVRTLGPDGTLRFDSRTDDLAVQQSLLSGLVGKIVPEETPVSLAAVEQALGPLDGRPEVQAARRGQSAFVARVTPGGEAVLLTLAVPAAGGETLVITQASRRGVRRLLALRRELVKLALYSTGTALLLALFLMRRLVHPLEALARAARRYPAVPLATPPLLARGDEIGELARAVTGLAQDLDARRRATADLGADIAHALKNPLAALRTAAELLTPASGRELGEERRRLIAARVEESVGRLERALDDLLHLLRIESELADEPRERLVYAHLIELVLDEYRRDARFAGWALRADVAEDVGEVEVAAERWAELLRNLLDNALIQPSARREVVVRVRRTREEIVTEVQDFGPGIPLEDQDKIFHRFFTRRPPGIPPGTGLGLSIVQSIAKAHGGQVGLASRPGEGTTFHVTLPSPSL
jgi:signal transduction histidine kinase